MLVVSAVSSEIFNDSSEEQRDLQRYRLRVQVLHEHLLKLGCLNVSEVMLSNADRGVRRHLDHSEKVTKQLEMEKILYKKLTEKLIGCEKSSSITQSTLSALTSGRDPITTTTITMTASTSTSEGVPYSDQPHGVMETGTQR